jgi:hypothetical protein
LASPFSEGVGVKWKQCKCQRCQLRLDLKFR